MDKKIKELHDLTNQKFDRLTALERGINHNSKYKQWYWKCVCDCGTEKLVRQSHLLKKLIRSCGCINKEKTKEKHGHWTGCGDMSGDFFGNIRRGARARNLEFSITKEFIWKLFLEQDKKCALTDIPLRFPLKENNYEGNASLDRIDNLKGYTEDNVEWIDKNVNTIKMDLTLGEFISICQKVAKKYANKEITTH